MIDREEMLEILESVLEERGEVVVSAYGFSMGKAWRGRRLKVVRDTRHIGLGSVVVFRRNERWYAHRVIWCRKGLDKEFFITKGDAFWAVDRPFVQKSDVLGVVTAFFDENGAEKGVEGVFSRFFGWILCLFGFSDFFVE